jgi:hypothetical protein
MARRRINFEHKAEWIRASAQSISGPSSFAERHYTVAEVAALGNLSLDAVRKLFQNEPGVLVLGAPPISEDIPPCASRIRAAAGPSQNDKGVRALTWAIIYLPNTVIAGRVEGGR